MDRRRRRWRAKPLLLWLDFAFTPQGRELRVAAARQFRLVYATRVDRALEDVALTRPHVLCFELDHLDESRKQVVEDVIQAHPRMPILMLTVEHSEALAVWAFRAGIWNYLVKPVSHEEFTINLERVLQVALHGTAPRAPRPPGVHFPRDLATPPVEARIGKLEPALQYVRRHFADKITEGEAARRCGMKRFAFSRNFHVAFGVTFRAYVMQTRIGEARRMLTEGGRPVTDVAYATGFSDGSYFARVFKQHTGLLPSDYGASRALPPSAA